VVGRCLSNGGFSSHLASHASETPQGASDRLGPGALLGRLLLGVLAAQSGITRLLLGLGIPFDGG